jgi:molybdopterin converting factor small subunit
MNITIKLLPPYSKKGEPNEYPLELKEEAISFQQLALHLSAVWKDRLGFPLLDEKEALTAEFIVNGNYVLNDYQLKDGDRLSIIPYICGG